MVTTRIYKWMDDERSGTASGAGQHRWKQMTDEAQTDDGCTVFDQFDVADSDPAEIWVDGTFENRYGDVRAYLDGKTYEAKDIIKFDWETTHHDFDGDSKRWVVDIGALDVLEEKLESAGFDCDFSTGDGRTESDLFDLHDYVEEGDDIVVQYEQKNGNGMSEYTGEVVAVDYNSGYGNKPKIAFRRHSDDHFMYVQFDKSPKACLYTGGSHSPYVGAVEQVVVCTDEDRSTESDASEQEQSGSDDNPSAVGMWS